MWARAAWAALAGIIMVLAGVGDDFAIGENKAIAKVGVAGPSENITICDRPRV